MDSTENAMKRSILWGTVAIVTSSLALAAMGVAGRGLRDHASVEIIIFFQGLVGGVIAGTALFIRPQLRSVVTQDFGLNLLRTLAGLGAYIVFFWSLKHITAAEAIILLNTAPFFLLIHKRFWKKERTTMAAWGMVTVGFLGLSVLVFHNQGSFGTFNPFLLIATSAGILVALTGIAMHALAGRGTVTYSTAFYGVVVAVGTLPLVVGEWINLTSVTFWLLLGAGVGFTIRAYTLQLSNYLLQPYIVAVLAYTSVIFSAFGDWLFFNHLPTLLQFVGMVVIAISGGTIVWIESRSTSAIPPTKEVKDSKS